MKTEEIRVANLKCAGCAATIQKELLKINGVLQAEVDIDHDKVIVGYDQINRELIINRLQKLGYPEATEKNGLLLQLKSYSSCMSGIISKL